MAAEIERSSYELVGRALDELQRLKALFSKAALEKERSAKAAAVQSKSQQGGLSDQRAHAESLKWAEIALQDDILRAEIKSLRSREEGNLSRIRQLERLLEQQSSTVDQLQQQIRTLEREREDTANSTDQQWVEIANQAQQLLVDKDSLQHIVSKVRAIHYEHCENNYIGRDEYDKLTHALKETQRQLTNLTLASNKRSADLESSLSENASLKIQLLQSQQREARLDSVRLRYEEEMEAQRQKIARLNDDLRESKTSAQIAAANLKAVEQNTEITVERLTAATHLCQLTQTRCEELEKELQSAARRSNQSESHSASSPPPAPPPSPASIPPTSTALSVAVASPQTSFASEHAARSYPKNGGTIRDDHALKFRKEATDMGAMHGVASFLSESGACVLCKGGAEGIMIACAKCRRKAHARCAKQNFRHPDRPESTILIKDLQRGVCSSCLEQEKRIPEH